MTFSRTFFGISVSVLIFSLLPLITDGEANALSLKAAVQKAIDNNPEILKSTENREATEFELRQARGLLLPSVDARASIGKRKLNSPSRRALDVEDNYLGQREASLSVTQRLLDNGGIAAEIDRQAARVDAASYRVLERTEAIALAVAREYFEILLQEEIISLTRRNRDSLNGLLSEISQAVEGGTLDGADRLQARERVQSAQADLQQAQQDLEEAGVRFERLVGYSFRSGSYPPSLMHHMPNSIHDALLMAGRVNPRIATAHADIDAARAQVRAAESDYLPTVDLEASARTGIDIDGSEGSTDDLQANVVLRWNLFNGGRTTSLVQERIRRVGEAQADRDTALLEIRELVSTAWVRRDRQRRLAGEFAEQANLNGQLVSSYREQLSVGTRSTLDLLSVQNTQFTSKVASKTAQYASAFANYEILASVGALVQSLHNSVPGQAEAYARDLFFSEDALIEAEYERIPSRQVSDNPFNLLTPILSK